MTGQNVSPRPPRRGLPAMMNASCLVADSGRGGPARADRAFHFITSKKRLPLISALFSQLGAEKFC